MTKSWRIRVKIEDPGRIDPFGQKRVAKPKQVRGLPGATHAGDDFEPLLLPQIKKIVPIPTHAGKYTGSERKMSIVHGNAQEKHFGQGLEAGMRNACDGVHNGPWSD